MVCTPPALPTVGGASEYPYKSINYGERINVKALRLLISIGVRGSLTAHASSVGWLMIRGGCGQIPFIEQ
jgi:hypothetical protein